MVRLKLLKFSNCKWWANYLINFFATQDAKKTIDVHLDKVNVMAKITEIKRNIDSIKINLPLLKIVISKMLSNRRIYPVMRSI